MDPKKIDEVKNVASKVGELLGGKFTSAGIFSTMIFLVIYFWEPISGFIKTAQESNEQRQEVKRLTEDNVNRIDSLQKTVDYVIFQDSEFMEMMITDLVEMEGRQSESERILMEEMDRVDTLGFTFEMTNPGNIYHYKDGHFYSPRYDRKEKKWFIEHNGSRVYLIPE